MFLDIEMQMLQQWYNLLKDIQHQPKSLQIIGINFTDIVTWVNISSTKIRQQFFIFSDLTLFCWLD